MAVYTGIIFPFEQETTLKRCRVLTMTSSYSDLKGDISSLSSIERRELFMPICTENISVDIPLMLNVIQIATNLFNLTPLYTNSNLALDLNHLNNEPENNAIKRGIKRGVKTIIHSQRIG